jgi:hypothetical protein
VKLEEAKKQDELAGDATPGTLNNNLQKKPR